MVVLATIAVVSVYVFLLYIGTLLQRLVLVQVVESRLARYCFSTSFATSATLLALVLVSAAVDAGLLRGTPLLPRRALREVLQHVGVGRVRGVGGGSSRDVMLFRALLGLLLLQVLCVGPALLFLLIAVGKHAARRRRRRLATARRGDLYEGAAHGGFRQRCSARRLLRFTVVVLVLGACAYGVYYLWQLALSMAEVLVLARKGLTVSVAAAKRASHVVLDKLSVPSEVPARNNGQAGDAAAAAAASPADAYTLSPAIVLQTYPTSATLRLLSLVIEVLTANVGVIGVVLVGLLSGFAAVLTPYNYVMCYWYYRSREDQLVQAQRALASKQRYMLTLCGTRCRRLAQDSYDSRSGLGAAQEDYVYDKAIAQESTYRGAETGSMGNGVTNGSGSSTGAAGGSGRRGSRWLGALFSRAKSSISSSSARAAQPQSRVTARERQQQRNDLEHAKGVSLLLYLKEDEVGYMLKEARRGGTRMGKLFALAGVLLVLYSLVKIALTAASLVMFTASMQDPVTRAVELLQRYSVLPAQTHGAAADAANGYAAYSLTALQLSTQLLRSLTVVVNTWMIAASVRGLLLTIFELTLSFSTVVTADTTAVLLAILMATYFIGQLVLLRQTIPLSNGASLADTLAAAAAPVVADSGLGAQQQQQQQQLDQHTLLMHANVLHVVLGGLPYYFYQRISEWSFLVGCALTFIARKWVLGDPAAATASMASG